MQFCIWKSSIRVCPFMAFA